MFNSDLIFRAGAPIVVRVWEKRSFGDYPAVTVSLDPKFLRKTNWPDAEYLYELCIEDPQSGCSNIGSERPQMTEQSEPIPDDVRQAFHNAVHVYADWKFGGAERPINFRKLQKISVSGVCELMLSYRNEPISADVNSDLFNLIDEIRKNPTAGLTYAAAAQCLLRLVDDQKKQKRVTAKRTDARKSGPWRAVHLTAVDKCSGHSRRPRRRYRFGAVWLGRPLSPGASTVR
jgi:hypothetical protein